MPFSSAGRTPDPTFPQPAGFGPLVVMLAESTTKGIEMTRQDFQLVAWALHREGVRTENWQAVTLAGNAIADAFAAQYPRFNKARFMAAVREGSK